MSNANTFNQFTQTGSDRIARPLRLCARIRYWNKAWVSKLVRKEQGWHLAAADGSSDICKQTTLRRSTTGAYPDTSCVRFLRPFSNGDGFHNYPGPMQHITHKQAFDATRLDATSHPSIMKPNPEQCACAFDGCVSNTGSYGANGGLCRPYQHTMSAIVCVACNASFWDTPGWDGQHLVGTITKTDLLFHTRHAYALCFVCREVARCICCVPLPAHLCMVQYMQVLWVPRCDASHSYHGAHIMTIRRELSSPLYGVSSQPALT